MIIDVTGVVLIPGNGGKDCPGNGIDSAVECCCDECDYMRCCMENPLPAACLTCDDAFCPFSGKG